MRSAIEGSASGGAWPAVKPETFQVPPMSIASKEFNPTVWAGT